MFLSKMLNDELNKFFLFKTDKFFYNDQLMNWIQLNGFDNDSYV